MIDARNVARRVEGSRKIWEFTPEQEKNLHAIVWLYRGETERYLQLVSQYLGDVVDEARQCFEWEDEEGQTLRPLHEYVDALKSLREILAPVLKSLSKKGQHRELVTELDKEFALFKQDIEQFHKRADKAASQWEQTPDTNAGLVKLTQQFEPMAETSRDLIKQTDLIYKLATRLIDELENVGRVSESVTRQSGSTRDITRARKTADEARQSAVEQLKQIRYFWKQAHWLTERFPEARLRNVEGLVKLVDINEIEANDWSLNPGRYVGVAPEIEDEDFDFEETLREIHVELEDLNAEAVKLAATIKRNFEVLGV